MYDPLFNPSRSITNKVDAMQFALIATMESRCGEPNRIHYGEAQKLYDFICDNVEFPVDASKIMAEKMEELIKALFGSEKDHTLYDQLFKKCDVPMADAVHAESIMSAMGNAMFKPRIREGKWHSSQLYPPDKDVLMAVVEAFKESRADATCYLARYSHESKAWCDFNTGEIIENVQLYYPVHYCVTLGLA